MFVVLSEMTREWKYRHKWKSRKFCLKMKKKLSYGEGCEALEPVAH